jgi:predicted site-specific integrase-resolvase
MSEKLMSISEVAATVGLSRQRFHQLMKEGVFPPPVYDIHTRRPHYTEEMLKVCLSVKEKNVGVNGKVVLFYARRSGGAQKKQISRQRSALPKRAPQHSGLIAGLKELGLTTVTEQQAEAALMELYPRGTAGVGDGELLRTVFVHLMRRN